MKLFHEGRLGDLLEHRMAALKGEVESQEQNYLLNANETQLVAYLVDKYRLEAIVLQEDKVYATDREEMIPAERFDQFRFHVMHGEAYRKQVVRFHLPFTGDSELLKFMPSTRILWTQDVPVERSEICFDVIAWNDDAAQIKREWDSFLNSVRTQVGYSTTEINAYNARLEQDAAQVIQARKAELLKKNNLLGSLGVPLKKTPEVPATFAVPAPKKKLAVTKPVAATAAFVPEPTLDEGTYNEILKIIHDTGIEIERHPSIYKGKDEETLRDHFLMVLSPHFSSVTGETFNKAGKTDILIRHEGRERFCCRVRHLERSQAVSWKDRSTVIVPDLA